MRKSLTAAVLAVVFAGGVSACGTPTETTPPSVDRPTSAANEAPEEQVEESTTPKPAAVKVPNVEGTNLQVSAHKLEKLGFTDVTPLPVDGHAFALNYANWVIVGQDPAAGKRVRTDIEIALEVAKTDEAENSYCFDNDCGAGVTRHIPRTGG